MKAGQTQNARDEWTTAPGAPADSRPYVALPSPPVRAGEQAIEQLFSSPFLHFGRSSCRNIDPISRVEKRPFAYSIVFPRAGCFVCHAGRREYIGEPGQALFFSPHEPYVVSHPGGSDDCTWFAIHEMALRDALEIHAPECAQRDTLIFPVPCCPVDAGVYRFVVMAEHLATRGRAEDPFLIQELVLTVLDRVLRAAAKLRGKVTRENLTSRAHEEIVNNVRTLLAMHHREPVDLRRAATTVHCSPFHLCRIFRARTGITLHRYLITLRLRSSLSEVLDPQVCLADLARRVGFSSHSHFTTAFAREFGVPPSILRRNANRARLDELASFADLPPLAR